MARDYDKEIAAAEAKLQRIRDAKAASERRRFEPVGKEMFAQFGVELSHCSGAVETKQFISELRHVYDSYLRRQAKLAAQSQNGSADNQHNI